MYYEKHRRSCNIKMSRVKVLAIMSAVLILLLVLNFQARRVICDAAAVQAENAFAQAVSDAVLEAAADGVSFDVITVNSGGEGEVVSVQSDTGRINLLKAALTQSLMRQLESKEVARLDISCGTLTGMELLAGRGPTVKMQLELRGGIKTDITSQFYEAGINQTIHRICCTVTADYYLLLPGCRFAVTLTTTVPIAESVIVGKVPDAYTYVVGDESDTIGRIFDYGAQSEP